MTKKEILAEVRKNPIGKEVLTRLYGARRTISSTIYRQVDKLVKPDDDMLCFALVMGTQNMGLDRGSYVEFAPTSGMVGVCKLSGNSLPIFEYKVFHAMPVMEFIKIQVQVSRPDRIEFNATIDSEGTADPKDHGKEMPIIEAYRKPFYLLANHLYNYFPHYQSPPCRNPIDMKKAMDEHIQEHVDFVMAQNRELKKVKKKMVERVVKGANFTPEQVEAIVKGPDLTPEQLRENIKELYNGPV